MANGFIAYKNRIDSSTLSGGSWAIPLTKLQNKRLSKVARSTDTLLSSTKIIIDQGEAAYNQCVALIGTNFENVTQWRIRAADNTSFTSPVLDTDWMEGYDAIRSTLETPWEDPEWWSGLPGEEDLEAYKRNLIYKADEIFTSRYVEIALDITGSSIPYGDVARAFLGPIWEFRTNFSIGSSYDFEDNTIVDESADGEVFTEERTQKRGFNLSLDFMEPSEAYSQMFDLNKKIGKHGEVLIVPDYGDTTNRFRQSFWGRLAELSEIEYKEGDIYSANLKILER